VKPITYSELKGSSKQFYALAAILAVFILVALACAY